MKTCNTCQWLIFAWGSNFCERKNMIISYPELAGRFCNSYEEVIENGKQDISEKERQEESSS